MAFAWMDGLDREVLGQFVAADGYIAPHCDAEDTMYGY